MIIIKKFLTTYFKFIGVLYFKHNITLNELVHESINFI